MLTLDLSVNLTIKKKKNSLRFIYEFSYPWYLNSIKSVNYLLLLILCRTF